MIRADLDDLGKRLAMPAAVAKKAMLVYSAALDKGIVHGRPISAFMAAAIYVACRETGTPRNLKDIERATSVKRYSIARCYRLLVGELGLKMPVADPVQCVARIASEAGIAERTRRRAASALRQAGRSEAFAGKDPMSLAAAAVYLACVENGEGRTQRDIADAANLTEVTVRIRYRGLRRHLGGPPGAGGAGAA